MTNAKAETMASMDDNAFLETFTVNGAVNLGGLSDDQRLAVGQNAYRALQNTTNMNVDRVALLNEVLEQSGYRPQPQQVEIMQPGQPGGGGAGGNVGGNAGAGGGGGTP